MCSMREHYAELVGERTRKKYKLTDGEDPGGPVDRYLKTIDFLPVKEKI